MEQKLETNKGNRYTLITMIVGSHAAASVMLSAHVV